MLKVRCNRIYLIRMGSAMLRESGGQPRHFSPPFSLKYIQALLLEKGKRVKLTDCLVNPQPLNQLLDDVLDWSASLVVVHSSIHSKKLALEFAALIKEKKDIPLIAVGQGPTANYVGYSFPGSAFDVTLLGEPELEVVSLLGALSQGQTREEVKEKYYKRLAKNEINTVSDLDCLPFPRYSTKEICDYQFFYPIRLNKKLRWGHLLSSRGCNYRCLFCSQVTRETFGDTVRFRSPFNVVNEMESLVSQGVNIISFDDDNFSFSKEHVSGICQEVLNRGLNIKWIAHARINELDFPLMGLMRQAGCIFLRLGVESGSSRIVELLRKNPNNSDWIEASKRLFGHARKIGIATNALFIIGNPTETESEIKETIRLAKLLKPDLIQVHFFTPYPGSLAYEQFKDKIGSEKKNISEMYHYCTPQLNLSNVAFHRLLKIRAEFYRNFFLRAAFLSEHFLKYMFFYLRNINVGYKLSKSYKILFYF
ncbi:B12-binding domain-containing radical SAM protein [Candidatus Omnitrophota bacterium]